MFIWVSDTAAAEDPKTCVAFQKVRPPTSVQVQHISVSCSLK